MSETLIDEVFRKAGGREALMRSLGTPDRPLSKQTMSDWKRAGRVPPHHAVAVEKITGIDRERLCPDFDWGREAPRTHHKKTKAD